MNLLLLQQEIIQQHPPGIPIHFSASSPSLGSPSLCGGMLGKYGWMEEITERCLIQRVYESSCCITHAVWKPPHTRSTTKHSTTKTHSTYYLCAEAAYLDHRISAVLSVGTGQNQLHSCSILVCTKSAARLKAISPSCCVSAPVQQMHGAIDPAQRY